VHFFNGGRIVWTRWSHLYLRDIVFCEKTTALLFLRQLCFLSTSFVNF